MKLWVGMALFVWPTLVSPAAAEWRADILPVPGRVTAIDDIGGSVRIATGQGWYRFKPHDGSVEAASAPDISALPVGALPDGRIAHGRETVARAWLAEPTGRYRHGVLGDAIEAASLVIERHNGRQATLRLGADAVFEDLEPRLVKLDGKERIIVVKSYLDRGSALAIVDPDSVSIIAETPPIGHPNAWLNPAGIADFDGDGTTDIAIVRQPHVVGRLELWSLRTGTLHKVAEVEGVSNHVIGSRVLGMSATADFDGDGRPDLAVPSLDRRVLRLLSFASKVHDIANVRLPARVTTRIVVTEVRSRPALVLGLENGQLLLVHNGQ